MAEPLNNGAVSELILAWKATPDGPSRDTLYVQIVEAVIPLIRSIIVRSNWQFTLNETVDDLVGEIALKMPKIIGGWQPERGSTFFSYFVSSVYNFCRGRYFRKQRRAKYHTDWPIDIDGQEKDIPDEHSERLNGSLETQVERSREFESRLFEIPQELADLAGPKFGGLVHYIASRYLTRADNHESLFLSELRREVEALPSAASLTISEIISLIRATIIGCRARLFPLRDRGFSQTDGSTRAGFFSRSNYRVWPYLLIFDDQAMTRLLLDCLPGAIENLPSRVKPAHVAQ